MWYHHQMSKMSPKAEQRRSEATASAMSGHGTVLRRRRWRRRGRTGSELTGRVGSAAQERRRRLVERRPRRSAFWSRRSEPGQCTAPSLVLPGPESSCCVRTVLGLERPFGSRSLSRHDNRRLPTSWLFTSSCSARSSLL